MGDLSSHVGGASIAARAEALADAMPPRMAKNGTNTALWIAVSPTTPRTAARKASLLFGQDN